MNTFGNIFKIRIFGASHAAYVGVEIEGCPSGLLLSPEMLQADLQRRKPFQIGTTKRSEEDVPEILSGVNNGMTTGSPIKIQFKNSNTNSSSYDIFKTIPRPSHADFVAMKKYGKEVDVRGGGQFSGRMTVGLVAAGAIAKQLLHPTTFVTELLEVGGRKDIEQAVLQAYKENDSLGGIVGCRVRNLPIGLGEPFFDGLESTISHIVFSIPGIKGIEFGSGFAASKMLGSEHNDCFIDENGTTKTNFSGGINGGISNGNELFFKVSVKPTASIGKPQQTFNFETKKMDTLIINGRHDSCFALRIPVVVEAVTAIALADSFLMFKKNKA